MEKPLWPAQTPSRRLSDLAALIQCNLFIEMKPADELEGPQAGYMARYALFQRPLWRPLERGGPCTRFAHAFAFIPSIA